MKFYVSCLILLLSLACSSQRSRENAGPQYQWVSKSVVSRDCYGTVAICLQETIQTAKQDCTKDSHLYEQESYEVTPTVALKYRCKWIVEPSAKNE